MGAFILIQDAVAAALTDAGDYDVMDGFPIPVAHGRGKFAHPGWLADIARIGKGGDDRYFYGVRMMMVINQEGVATGWDSRLRQCPGALGGGVTLTVPVRGCLGCKGRLTLRRTNPR